MPITDTSNKKKIAIVVVGYNRLDSIKRVLSSIDNAHYTTDVPLVMSIDASGCQPLYDYVRNYKWKHGDKYVYIKENRMGLRDHIFSCGDLTKFFRAVIILEDDIFAGEYFYDYTMKAVETYDSDDRIGGISLYHPMMDGNLPVDYVQDSNDVFAFQNVESWGQCWTERMWKEFKSWYNDTLEHDFSNIDMPNHIKKWEKAWSKFYMAFQIENDKYFIYPSVSLTTCFSEAGEHGFTSSIGQTVLLSGHRDFVMPDFEFLSKYDIYGTNESVYSWLNISRNDLCVNMNGSNSNLQKKRYILSPYSYPYKIIKKFALSLRPIELNVKYNVVGNGLFLYDTENKVYSDKSIKYPLSLAYYHIRQFNIKVLYRYIASYTASTIFAKTKKLFKQLIRV